MNQTALLLIAHGSRRADANADLVHVADEIAKRGDYYHIQVSYLELAEPNIESGGTLCVEKGAKTVILLPYFLSPGVHVIEDLTEAREHLAAKYPAVEFLLAEPMGRHPKIVDVIVERATQVLPQK